MSNESKRPVVKLDLAVGTKVKVNGHEAHNIKDGAECVVIETPYIVALFGGDSLNATMVRGEVKQEFLHMLPKGQVEEGQLIPNECIEVIE